MSSMPGSVRLLGCDSVRAVNLIRKLRILFVNCAALLLLAAATSTAGRAQQSLQVLHNHVRPEVSQRQAALVGPLSTDQPLHLSIVLPLRNQAALTSLLGRLYDPSSPDYRHFLTVAEFTQQFGPTVEDYQAVVAFAQANGLTVTDAPANRLVVPVSGTVAQINQAFNVRMNVYQHPTEDRTFFSPDREPALNLGVPIAHISGLDNFSLPHPMLELPQDALPLTVTVPALAAPIWAAICARHITAGQLWTATDRPSGSWSSTATT